MQSRPLTGSVNQSDLNIEEETIEVVIENQTQAEIPSTVVEQASEAQNTVSNVLQEVAQDVKEIKEQAVKEVEEAVAALSPKTPAFTFKQIRDAFFDVLAGELKDKTPQKDKNNPDKWITIDQLPKPRNLQYAKNFKFIEQLNVRTDINETQKANAAYAAMLEFLEEVASEYKFLDPDRSYTHKSIKDKILGISDAKKLDENFVMQLKQTLQEVGKLLDVPQAARESKEYNFKVLSEEEGNKIEDKQRNLLSQALTQDLQNNQHIKKAKQDEQIAEQKKAVLKELKGSFWNKSFFSPKTNVTRDVVVDESVDVKRDIQVRRNNR